MAGNKIVVFDLARPGVEGKYVAPGPGSYDVALPMVRPNFEAIRKKNDVIILKVNHHRESYNFISEQERFPSPKPGAPGPGEYKLNSSTSRSKKQTNKKHSQRYSDLIDFMYKNRSKIEPMPDYNVEYEEHYANSLKMIKNSQRRVPQNQHQTLDVTPRKMSTSTSKIVEIRSSSKLALDLATLELGESRKQCEATVETYMTIGMPEPSANLKSTKRHLEKEEKLLLHRRTLYNRNMLGMLILKPQKQGRSQNVRENAEFSYAPQRRPHFYNHSSKK